MHDRTTWLAREAGPAMVRMAAVAGFDFEFTYSKAQESIVEVCLAAAGTRARQLHLRWHWRTISARRVVVTINGNSRRMDSATGSSAIYRSRRRATPLEPWRVGRVRPTSKPLAPA